ncbi:MAG: tetratricopeptide repeat protein [Planctomycetes bacterium]|nr:tetratricopeptide repeat protein [Planctomycetota bacterium]
MPRAFCLVAIVLSLLILIQPPCLGGEADEAMAAARKEMLIDKNYEAAALSFLDFIEKYPDHQQAPVALAYMALCYTALNMHEEAADSYTKLLEEYPGASAQLRQDAMSYGGNASLKSERFDEAAKRYTQLLTEFPNSPPTNEARFSRALCWHRLAEKENDTAAQQDYLAKALEDYASSYTPELDSAKAAIASFSACKIGYQLGDNAKAAKFGRLFINNFSDDPRKPEVLTCLAEALLNLKQYEASRQAFMDLLALDLEINLSLKALEGMGWCDYYLGEFNDAGDSFNQAAESMGGNPAKAAELHFHAGQAYQNAGKLAEAQAQYLKVAAVKNHPQHGNALLQLGLMKSEQSRQATLTPEQRATVLAEVVDCFEKALPLIKEKSEDALNARLYLGETLIEAKDFIKAAKILGEVAQYHPDSRQAPWALYNRALSLDKAGQAAEAAKTIAELVKKYPDNPVRLQAVYAGADFYAVSKQEEQAREAYDWLANNAVSWAAKVLDEQGRPSAELVEKAKQFASDALFRLADLYKSQKDLTKAAESYRLFITEYPNHPEIATARLRLAAIAEEEGDFDKAEREYSLALVNMDDNKQKVEATYRLAIINLTRAQQEDDMEARTALLTSAQRSIDNFIASEQDPSRHAQAYYYRAETKYLGGFKEQALADYNFSLSKDSRGEFSDKALFGAAWCLRDIGKPEEACASFQKLAQDFPDSTHRPEALYLVGILKKDAGDYKAAEQALNTLLKEYPEHTRRADSELEKGKLLVVMGKTEKAVEIFDNFLAQLSEHTYTEQFLQELSWAWQAILDARQQAVQEAETALEKFLDGKTLATLSKKMQEPGKHLQAACESARALAIETEDKLKNILQRLAKEYPASKFLDMIYMRLGEIEYRHEKYVQALEYYNQAYQKAGKNTESKLPDKALYRIAWCYLHLSESKGAPGLPAEEGNQKPAGVKSEQWKTMSLRYFQLLAKTYPDSEYWADACFRSAELQRDFEEYETAIENYSRALQRSPQARFARAAQYGIQLCNLGLQQYDAALKNGMAFLERYNEGEYLHEANWVVGESLLMLNAYEDAEKYFNAALANRYAGKVAAKSQYGLGMLALKQERLEDARKEMYKVAALHSRWPNWAAQALLEASRISIRLGQKDKAADDLKRIIKHYPDTPASAKAKELLQSLTRDINLRRRNPTETKKIRV